MLQEVILALAQATGGGGGGGAPGGGGGGGGQPPPAGCGAGGATQLLFPLLILAVFYFIMLRPQQKRAKQHAQMLSNLQKGDQVVTRGGLIGKVSGVQDNVITLELQEKVRVKILKSYIEGRHEAGSTAPPAPTEKST